MIEKTLEITERYLHSYKNVKNLFDYPVELKKLSSLVCTQSYNLNLSGKRKKQIRNLYSYLDRRKKIKNGGYLESSICSGCGRAITKNNELCRDCKK